MPCLPGMTMSLGGTSAALPLQSRTVAVSESNAVAAVNARPVLGSSLTVLTITSPSRVTAIDLTISLASHAPLLQCQAPR